jgi:hypothetical protein
MISPVADLYIVLYNSIVSSPTTGHGRHGYYFGENGEYTHYEAAKAVAEALVTKGLGKTLEPSSFTDDEIKQQPTVSKLHKCWRHMRLTVAKLYYLGTNSRCRADHSRSIGWKPTKTTKDLLASIKPELDEVLKSRGE